MGLRSNMKEGHYSVDNKYTAASLKDVCDCLNKGNPDTLSAIISNYNGRFPKMEGDSLEVEVYIHDEYHAEVYLARAFKDAVNECHAQGIHDFDIDLLKADDDGFRFSLVISGSMTESHYDTDKPVAANIKDLCDYINNNYHSMFTAKVDGDNKLLIYMYGSSNESEAEEYLAKTFKSVVAACRANISGFDIEMLDYIGFSGVKFELTIDSNAMTESRSLDIGDIPSNTEKTISSETKLNQAFNDEFDKKIKENVEVLKSYNEYDALKALKAAYEKLPEQLTVADLSDVLHTLNICYHQTVKSTECKEKLWYKDEAFDKAICGIVGAWKHQLTGAEYDAAVKKHQFLTKLFYGSKKDAIFNGNCGHSDEDMTAASKYLESCTSKRLGENRLLDIGEIPDKDTSKVAKVNANTKLSKAFDELLEKTIKNNAEILKKYEQYDVLRKLKAAYEKLPEDLTVADAPAIQDLFGIENDIHDNDCMHEVRESEKELWIATSNFIIARGRNETGAKYDAAAAVHPKLTKFFNGSREDAIHNGDYGNSTPDAGMIDKYTESRISRKHMERR